MNYFDRILSRSDFVPSSKDEVQLLALTCFYLAVKLYQSGPVLSTSQMAQISGDRYSAKQISATEQKVLFMLEWRLHSPCATDFFRQFYDIILRNMGSCLPVDIRQGVLEMTSTIIHASVLDYFFVANQIRPSHLAVASLLISLKYFLPSLSSIQDILQLLNQLTGNHLDTDEVAFCCKRLLFIINGRPQPKSSQLFYTPLTIANFEMGAPLVSPHLCNPGGK